MTLFCGCPQELVSLSRERYRGRQLGLVPDRGFLRWFYDLLDFLEGGADDVAEW